MPFINKSKIRTAVPAGEQAYGEIIVENPTSEVRSMRLYLEDWYYLPGGDGSKEFLAAGSLSRSCSSWVSFSPAEFTIPPFGKQRVSYSIKVPTDTKGGYYAALFFETVAGELGDTIEGVGAGIKVNVRIATLFYVEVEGTVRRNGLVGNLSVKKDSASNSLLIETDFSNNGNVDMTVGGTYHIMDKEGIIYARGAFNNIYTYPGDKARLSATWKEPIPRGRYDLVLTLDYGKALEETGFGRGPVVTKEAGIEIGANGEILGVGELR